jgi:predicted nucleotidyltransferase
MIMLIDELRAKREIIVSTALEYGASNVKVFGSVARRKEKGDSDYEYAFHLDP